MRIVFDHREQVTPTIWTFAFRPDKPLHYIAGQYAEIQLPHSNPDSRGEQRWFTISSAPGDALVRITTKLTEKDGSSFKHALLALRPGAVLNISEPMGDFVLPKDTSIPLIFVAGGIGITPMYSMVKWLHETGEQRPITLLHTVQSAGDLIFVDLFRTYDLAFVPIVSRASKDWQGETGTLTGERIMKFAGPAHAANGLFYFSGPEPMVENLIAEIKRFGVAPHRIVMDYFPGYAEL